MARASEAVRAARPSPFSSGTIMHRHAAPVLAAQRAGGEGDAVQPSETAGGRATKAHERMRALWHTRPHKHTHTRAPRNTRAEPHAHARTYTQLHQCLSYGARVRQRCVFNGLALTVGERCSIRVQFGTKFAFHGSQSHNWHSILRKGLKVTTPRLHAPAYGCGRGRQVASGACRTTATRQ